MTPSDGNPRRHVPAIPRADDKPRRGVDKQTPPARRRNSGTSHRSLAHGCEDREPTPHQRETVKWQAPCTPKPREETHVRSTFRRWRRHSHRRRARPRGDYRPSALGESIRDHLGRRTRGVSRREVHGVCRDVMTMTMRPRLRKFVLTAHVVSSVGWLGAAAAYVVLAVLVLTTRNAQM